MLKTTPSFHRILTNPHATSPCGILRRCCLLVGWFLASCNFWLPDAMPLPDQPLATQTSFRVAAVLVDGAEQPFLTPWVVLSPAAPPVFAAQHLPVTIPADLAKNIPWRAEGETRYTPGIATLTRDAQGILLLSALDTTIREQTVANHDSQRLVRLVGTLQPRDGALVLVDRSDKTAFLPFFAPLVPTSPIMVTTQSGTRLGDELLVEGVVSSDRLIPLVFAPVFRLR